jgi:hypothetical protein
VLFPFGDHATPVEAWFVFFGLNGHISGAYPNIRSMDTGYKFKFDNGRRQIWNTTSAWHTGAVLFTFGVLSRNPLPLLS